MHVISEAFRSPLIKFLSEHENRLKTDPKATALIGLVLYCDGGFTEHPSGGRGGFGVHGYYYDFEERKAGYGLKNSAPTDYGYMGPAIALKDEKGKALRVSHTGDLKEALPVRINAYVDAYGTIGHEGTNNVAELMAVIHALDVIETSLPYIKEAHLVLDSEYVLKGLLKWAEGWKKNQWRKSDGSEVANVHHWKQIVDSYDRVVQSGIRIDVDWVKGHSDDVGNIKADELATRGTRVGYNQADFIRLSISEISKYWNPVSAVHAVAKEPRHYILVNARPSNLKGHVYIFGNQGSKDEVLGEPSGDRMHAVIRCDEALKAYEALKDYVLKRSDSTTSLIEVRNDIVIKASVYNDLEQNGGLHLSHNAKGEIFALDKDPIATQVRSSGLNQKLIPRLEWLVSLLESFVAGELKTDGLIKVECITPLVYETLTDKKGKSVFKLIKSPKINPVIEAGTSDQPKQIKPTLIYGRDLPNHSVLLSLADLNPQLFVVAWPDSLISYRYATLVKADGVDGIWCAVYANYIIEPFKD